MNENTQIKRKNFQFLEICMFAVFIVLISTCIPKTAFCETSDVNSYDYLKLKIDNNINFQLQKDSDFSVKTFELTSYFLPQSFNGTQYLNSFTTNHEKYSVRNDSSGIYYLVYSFDKSDLMTYNTIKNEFVVESVTYNPQIKQKVKYPITQVSKENMKYLNFEDLIDIDDDIRAQASALATGEDDTYLIASKVAKWIKEDVNYDLSTVTQNPNQKSTQVFKSKKGVCKEISNLYISMMRSLGIPARVVTGYAYTNSEEIVKFTGSNWGGHAWVEVLIGETWVPFDLTYNQYGYVDASHVILDRSTHIRTSNILINSTGYGYEFVGNSDVQNDFEIIEKLDKININPNNYKIEISGPNELGFESYGYIKVDVKNEDDFYKILFIRVSKINEIENLDSLEKMIIFKPYEDKEVYFRYKINDTTLRPNYEYTFPFTVYNDNFEQKFNVTVREDFMNIKKIALPFSIEEQTELSNNNLIFDCNYIYSLDSNKIICSVKNPNNYEIQNLRICVRDDCKIVDLKLNEMKTISFDTQNFNETIYYSYDKENGNLYVFMKEPTLGVKYNLNSTNALSINTSIDNFAKGLTVEFYVNDELIYETKEYKSQVVVGLGKGDNKIRILLKSPTKTLDSKDFVVSVKKSFSDGSGKSFWERLVEFFRNLFL